MLDEKERIAAELRAVWSRKLNYWWHHYNEEYLRGGLRPPGIELGLGEVELGRWERQGRRLVISARHIERDPWLEVMETLRHEMAHQYADEVLKASGEGPHGRGFVQGCEKLRCSPRSRADGKDGQASSAEDGILQRLKKVLSLAESPNEHEAETAVKKARRLLLKYNIDATEFAQERRFGHRHLGAIKGRRASYEMWLAQILHEFFFVETIWVHSYRPLEDREGTILRVCGTPANLDMAEYVYDYLIQLLERLWAEYRQTRGLRGNRERQRYFAGVLEGFHQKLQEQERAIQTEQALVWKGDSQLGEYYRYLHPRIRTRYGRGVTASDAYKDGVEEGRKVTIHRPIGDDKGGFGGYLKGA